mmetsp:Transcript_57185/g.107527  ORF Transcript_57185/g.107527 Transcript_57185/m.107527 type:complete len:165 (-) Transcript_57185:8-502(-)
MIPVFMCRSALALRLVFVSVLIALASSAILPSGHSLQPDSKVVRNVQGSLEISRNKKLAGPSSLMRHEKGERLILPPAALLEQDLPVLERCNFTGSLGDPKCPEINGNIFKWCKCWRTNMGKLGAGEQEWCCPQEIIPETQSYECVKTCPGAAPPHGGGSASGM